MSAFAGRTETAQLGSSQISIIIIDFFTTATVTATRTRTRTTIIFALCQIQLE
jgi:hypothetical protein